MVIAEIAGLITAITGLVGACWAIVKYYDSKKQKRHDQIVQTLMEQNSKQDEVLKETCEVIKDTRQQLADTQEQLRAMQQAMHDDELDKLRNDLINFACKLRNGFEMSSVDYEHIHTVYDKYILMGGNSYIQLDCFPYILECEALSHQPITRPNSQDE